jgi:hypothetical protein
MPSASGTARQLWNKVVDSKNLYVRSRRFAPNGDGGCLRLSFSVQRLDAIGASSLKLGVDLPANQERQPGDVQPRQ